MRDPDEKHDAWRNGDLDPPWWWGNRKPRYSYVSPHWQINWDNMIYGSPLMKQEYERR